MKIFRVTKASITFVTFIAFVFSIVLIPVLSGCDGDSGNVTSMPMTGGGANGRIGGMAVKGPVNGGMVTAYGVDNGASSGRLGTATTDPQGNFNMMIGDYSGPVMLTMSGGTYMDEATGFMTTMGGNDMMTAAIPSFSSGGMVTGIQMTPLTSMAQAMAADMPGGMTAANMSDANMAMGNYFMVNDILATTPMNPNVTGSGAKATQDMRNYGMAIATMMENAKTLGMTSSSGMVTAMMSDVSDGYMNGMMGGSVPIAMGGGMSMMGGGTMMQANMGTSGMADTMTSFMNSRMNKSGLTVADMQALMDHLNSTSGAIR